MFAPQLTRSTTQPGDPASAAWSWAGMPPAIRGCAWSRPSKTHRAPKPIRSNWRARGSRQSVSEFWSPIAVLITAQVASTKKKIRATISAWCSSAERNAATRIELAGLGPEFMPGMRPPYGGNHPRPGRAGEHEHNVILVNRPWSTAGGGATAGRSGAGGGGVPLAESPEGGADNGDAEQQERDDVDARAVLADRSDLEFSVDQVHHEAHAHDDRPKPDDVDPAAGDPQRAAAAEAPRPRREDHHREDVERQAE